jgi:hypothetical protein
VKVVNQSGNTLNIRCKNTVANHLFLGLEDIATQNKFEVAILMGESI